MQPLVFLIRRRLKWGLEAPGMLRRSQARGSCPASICHTYRRNNVNTQSYWRLPCKFFVSSFALEIIEDISLNVSAMAGMDIVARRTVTAFSEDLTNSWVDALMVYGLFSLFLTSNFQPGVIKARKNIFELFLDQR